MSQTTGSMVDCSRPPPLAGGTHYVSLLVAVAALGGLLFGYDTAVISGAIGFLQAKFALSSFWEGFAAACALAGCILGAAAAGVLSDRIGRKKVLILAAIMFFVSAVGTALPRNLTEFIAFRIVGGVGIGAASMTSPMYIAEVSPFRIRGRMVSVNQFAIISGMLVIYFVNYFVVAYGTAVDRQAVADYQRQHGPELDAGRVAAHLAAKLPEKDREDFLSQYQQVVAAQPSVAFALVEKLVADYAATSKRKLNTDRLAVELAGHGLVSWNVEPGWRWMFGSGIVPSLLLLVLLLLVPESPRWLTERGQREQAQAILTRIDGADNARRELASIEETIAAESGTLSQLFQPRLRRVLGIGVVLAVLQQVTGINVFLYFAPAIFEGLGSGTNAALLQTVVVGAVNLAFTVVAIGTVDRIGRKPLMLFGAGGMGVSLVALGLAAYFQVIGVWALAFILGYIACFALSVGPVTWVILSEIFPTRIRGRAMAIATVCLWAANFVVSQTFPMLDKDPWLVQTFHHSFPFWVYAAFCAVSVVFVWRMVPETKGKSLEQIERSWLPQGER